MKRIIAFVFVVLFLVTFVSCREDSNDIINQAYFRGKVIEKYEKSCLLEVVDTGNQLITIGDKIVVKTDIDKCPQYEVGDYLRIVYGGEMALSYPPQIFDVYAIHKTDEIGNNINDN